jgi:hypothetical protein
MIAARRRTSHCTEAANSDFLQTVLLKSKLVRGRFAALLSSLVMRFC